MKTDTIAAIATAMSESGIGIIRISGKDAISIANHIFCTRGGKQILEHVESHTIHYGYIVDNFSEKESDMCKTFNRNIVDEVMVSVFKAPRSYTTEDTVEINCHGGVLMMRRILEIVLNAGARLAQPGEFTKRAFLNGRIDLSEAEAVMDIIQSKNDFALKNSVRQLKGSVLESVKELRKEILYENAFIESALDDPEHISLEGYSEALYEKISNLISRVKKLIASAENGKMLKEGIKTVILGKPNAGKSSLLNTLVGEEKAIVTDIAGTTRDVLEENISLNGISLNIIDTAGIRETKDYVEKIGVERAKSYAGIADLIIYMADSSVSLDENDKEIVEIIGNKKCIVLLNKTDLKQKIEEDDIKELFKNSDNAEKDSLSENVKIIRTSTKENTGIEDFENAVTEMFFHGEIVSDDEVCITNMRHKEALTDACQSLMQVKLSIEDGMPEDFYSIDLMSAYISLGSIIGEEINDDLVDEIFSKFCMGK